MPAIDDLAHDIKIQDSTTQTSNIATAQLPQREIHPPMEKANVIRSLHAMMISRLFDERPWLADREACAALHKKLDDLGLQECVPGDDSSTRSTALGNELNMDLVMVFIGLWDEWEMPIILERFGLIDETDELRIYELLETCSDPERLLRPIVRKAYRDHYNPSRLLV